MPSLFPVHEPNRHWGCRVNDRIVWNDIRSVILQNELLQIVVHIDKGTEITQFLYKPLDVDFIWRGHRDLHNPANFASGYGTDSTPFFDHWSGGWFEVVPNNGPGCDYKNTHLGFFGETTNIPWEYHILEDTPERVRVAFWVKTYRTPLLLRKTLTLVSGKAALFIEEEVTNYGGEPVDFAWGHHPVIGPPFLDGSCRIACPDSRVIVLHDEDGPDHRMQLHQEGRWPWVKDLNGNPLDLRVVLPAEAKTMDNCYLTDFREGWVGVTNLAQGVGFGFAWDTAVFRYFWLWQAFGGGKGFPWYSHSYQMGIEPWSSYPCAGLQEAISNGTALRLDPGDSRRSWLTAVAYRSDREPILIHRDGNVEY